MNHFQTLAIRFRHEMARNEIPDFSHRPNHEQRADFASSLCFLDEFYRFASVAYEVKPVIGGYNTDIATYVDQILSTPMVIPPYRMIPSWEKAPPSVWLAYIHAMLLLRQETGSCWCFSLNLHEEKVKAAFNRKNASPASYYHDRVQRQLKKFGHIVSWQCVEIAFENLSKSKSPARAIFKAKHHLHGAFHISEEVDPVDLRRALRAAAGEFPVRFRNKQAELRKPIKGHESRWPRFYSRKQASSLVAVYGQRPFSYSQELVAPARLLYEVSREALNERRRILVN